MHDPPAPAALDFKNHCAIANSDSQNAPKPQNSTPEKVFPVRNWMIPAISAVMPPHISATPNTTGSTPLEIAAALIMLSMNVGTPKANSASGAELPQLSVVSLGGAAGSVRGAPLCAASSPADRAAMGGGISTIAMMQSLLRCVENVGAPSGDGHRRSAHRPDQLRYRAMRSA